MTGRRDDRPTQDELLELLEDSFDEADDPARGGRRAPRGARSRAKGLDERTPRARAARRQELARRYRAKGGRA